MVWFFTKKKVVTETKKGEEVREVQVLEQKEKRIIRREIEFCEKAGTAISEAKYNLPRVDFCYFQSKGAYKRVKEEFKKAEGLLLNIKIYTPKLVKLAQRLEADLLDIRGGAKESIFQFLSSDELRVISFAKKINNNIDIIIQNIRTLNGLLSEDLIAYQPSDVPEEYRQSARDAATTLNSLVLLISGFHKNLLDLFELEEKVEELTAAYING